MASQLCCRILKKRADSSNVSSLDPVNAVIVSKLKVDLSVKETVGTGTPGV
jgi:hypothetical protein